MKKLGEIKTLNNLFVDNAQELHDKIKLSLERMKQEYQRNVILEKVKLLQSISSGEKLDFEKMKSKYLKGKELLPTANSKDVTIGLTKTEQIPPPLDLLDYVELSEGKFFYENKESGIVYNESFEPVGTYSQGTFTFN
jgi:hypothetical protein